MSICLGKLAYLVFAQCMSNTDAPYKCRDLRDDYLECLHHRKEVSSTPGPLVYKINVNFVGDHNLTARCSQVSMKADLFSAVHTAQRHLQRRAKTKT